jgi:DNA-binding FadR family transcriptional regulator
MSTHGSPMAILETRRMLEPEVAALAAQRRTDDDLSEMRDALASMEQGIREGIQSPSPDNLHLDFHLAVARSTGNPVVIAVEEFVIRQTYDGVWQSLRELDSPIPRQEYLAQHWELFKAIEAKDSARARQASIRHFKLMASDLSK